MMVPKPAIPPEEASCHWSMRISMLMVTWLELVVRAQGTDIYHEKRVSVCIKSKRDF